MIENNIFKYVTVSVFLVFHKIKAQKASNLTQKSVVSNPAVSYLGKSPNDRQPDRWCQSLAFSSTCIGECLLASPEASIGEVECICPVAMTTSRVERSITAFAEVTALHLSIQGNKDSVKSAISNGH